MSSDLRIKLERLAERYPDGLRLRAGWANTSGYLLLGALMLVGVGLPIGVVLLVVSSDSGWSLLVQFLIHGGFLLPVLSWQILVALQMDPFEPEGIEVDDENDQGLREEVARMADLLDAPRPERILLTSEIGASAIQQPRLRPGEGGNILQVGLPLLECLELDEFRSVLAHELGHFAGDDGRRWGSMVRQGLAWNRLHERMRTGQFRSRWLGAIVGRFAPWHSCHAMVLSRSQERLADECSVRAVGGSAPARALARVVWCSRRADEEHWAQIGKLPLRGEAMPESVFDDQARLLASGVEPSEAIRLWDEVVSSPPAADDTHPPLVERIRALGGDPATIGTEIARAPREPAAQRLLRDVEALRRRMSERWMEKAREGWELQKGRREELARRKAELEAMTDSDIEVVLERAGLVEALDGDDALRSFLASIPSSPDEDVRLRILRKRLEIETGSAEAAADLEGILASDPSRAGIILPVLIEASAKRGDQDKVRSLREQLVRAMEAWKALEAASETISEADRFEGAQLDDSTRRRLGLAILEDEGVQEAWILRKVVPGTEALPPLHVVFLSQKLSRFGTSTAEARRDLVNGAIGRILKSGLLQGVFVVSLLVDGERDWQRKRIDQAGGEVNSLL